MALRDHQASVRRVLLLGLWSCAALASPAAPVLDPLSTVPVPGMSLSTMPAWFFQSNKSGTALGASVAAAGDVNGDGFDDFLVGAPFYDTSSQSDVGSVSLFRGQAAGPGFAASWFLQGTSSSGRVGASVAGAGDVNGDGYDDVLVGEPGYTEGQSGEGRARLFFGAATWPAATAAWSVQADQAGAALGTIVAGAGDVNGDGYDDVLVTAPAYNQGFSDNGIVRIYHGSATGLGSLPARTIAGEVDGLLLGESSAGVGDVDGDGFDDVVIGTVNHHSPFTWAGRVALYPGSSTGVSATPVWSFEGESQSASLGRWVSGAGDVNDDGFADVIVGADLNDNGHGDPGTVRREGKAYLFLGGAGGLPSSPSWTAEGSQDQERFGYRVAGLGDVDGDGYGDVAVGSLTFNDPDIAGTNEGAVRIYLGLATVPSASASWMATGTKADGTFGGALATAGDPDGDGLTGLLVGSPAYSDGQSGEGAVSLFFGPDVPNPCLDLDGDGYGNPGHPACRNGGAADCNDGSPTTWPGAPERCNSVDDNCNSQVDEGFITLGGSCLLGVGLCTRTGRTVCGADGLSTTCGAATPGAPQPEICDGYDNDCDAQVDEGLPDPDACGIAAATQRSGWLGNSVASAGDVNGDGFDDVIAGAPRVSDFRGEIWLLPGTAAGIAHVPSWIAGPPVTPPGSQRQSFGDTVSGAGDVDGDGLADIIVGAPLYEQDLIAGTSRGAAYLYRGSATTPQFAWSATGSFPNDRFGSRVSGVGDLNGDRRSEIAVTASGGRAHVFSFSWHGPGPPTLTQWTLQAAAPQLVPVGLSGGNFNADRFDDLLIGWTSTNSALPGQVALHLGGSGGPAASPVWVATAPNAEPSYGRSVAAVGDVDGNGWNDVLVGAPPPGIPGVSASGTGRAYLYFGTSSGLSTSPGWTVASSNPDDAFGWSVAAAGDVNSDGYADILVGAPAFDDNHANEGRTFLFLGGPAGPSALSAWQASPADQVQSLSGYSLAMTRRLQPAGIPEVVMGAPQFDSGGAAAAGRVDFAQVCLDVAHDADGDGVGDACDCAPGQTGVLSPGPVGPSLVVSHNATPASIRLTWLQPAGATHSNAYRGSIPAGGMGSRPDPYDHACFESADALGDGATITNDAAVPPIGQAFYYLVSSENGCGESELGILWSGAGPTPTMSCATPP